MEGVTGSIPVPPTIISRAEARLMMVPSIAPGRDLSDARPRMTSAPRVSDLRAAQQGDFSKLKLDRIRWLHGSHGFGNLTLRFGGLKPPPGRRQQLGLHRQPGHPV